MTRSKIARLIMVAVMMAAVGMYAACSDNSADIDTEVPDSADTDTEAAEKFGINFPYALSGEPTFELAAADLPSVDSMTVYKLGYPVVTTKRVSDILYPPYEPSLPSEEEAKIIAFEFLNEAGLLPDDYGEFNMIADDIEVRIGGGSSMTKNGEIIYEYTTCLLVSFPRRIGGFPVIGSEDTLGVRIGDKGEVGSVSKNWLRVTPYGEVAIKSAEEAYQGLVTGKGSYYVPLDCERVIVEQVSLSYWMESRGDWGYTVSIAPWLEPQPERQEYLAPVYEFKGECLDEDGDYLKEFCGWCEALHYCPCGSPELPVDVEADFVMVGFEDQSTIVLTKGTPEFDMISNEAIAVYQGIYVAVETMVSPDQMETIKRDSKFVEIGFDRPVKVSISRLVQAEDRDRFLYDEEGYQVIELNSAVFVFTGEYAGLVFYNKDDQADWHVFASKRSFDWLEDMVDYVGRLFGPSST